MINSSSITSWKVARLIERTTPPELQSLSNFTITDDQIDHWRMITDEPDQVHVHLLQSGEIKPEVEQGLTETAAWVAESDWVYSGSFKPTNRGERLFLRAEGLDTICDIFVNGYYAGGSRTMFKPLMLDLSPLVDYNSENTIYFYFYSPQHQINSAELPSHWESRVSATKVLRKSQHDFDNYLGATPSLTKIGIFNKVELQSFPGNRITDCDVEIYLSDTYSRAEVDICSRLEFSPDSARIEAELFDPDKKSILRLEDTADKPLRMVVDSPHLWWPRGYGDQPLYTLTVKLIENDLLTDQITRQIGFRKIEMGNLFDFSINGRRIKLWGANIAPLRGLSHRWDQQVAERLLQLVENAHMNILRVWGEGPSWPDELYAEADKRGILLWQDFNLEARMQPDSEEFIRLVLAEAESIVRRRKHHASVMLWCGGNENYMWSDIEQPGEEAIGSRLFSHDLELLVKRLDPTRVYLKTSPYTSGDFGFSNDPRNGDTHGLEHQWFYIPGIDYPTMFSENTRTSAPPPWSMKRMLGDNLWPEEFSSLRTYGKEYPVPESWVYRSTERMWEKTGPLEHYYDAASAEELIYAMGAARAEHFRESVGRCRRGRPFWEHHLPRRGMGHMVWKLNDTWPQIYTSIIDYYQEPYIPYYELRRMYTPLLLEFEIQDEIRLWCVNDTPRQYAGFLRLEVFDPKQNSTVWSKEALISISPGESSIAATLADAGPIRRHCLLRARFFCEDEVVAETSRYLDIERHLTFPDPDLELQLTDTGIIIRSSQYAHCIELSGEHEGNRFGWAFEDNYFHLFPGDDKHITILRAPNGGTIRAKTHYGQTSTQIAYTR